MWFALCGGLFLGVLKGRTVLKRAARRNVDALLAMSPTAGIKALFPIRLIGLVLFMIGLGVVIRSTPYDPQLKAWIVGVLYPGISLGLLIGAVEILRWCKSESAGTEAKH